MTKIKVWEYKSKVHVDEYNNNAKLAKSIAKKDSLEELSLAYTHINSDSITKFFNYIPNIENYLIGNGIDLGGGPGIISGTLVNNFPKIECITLLEIVQSVLESCFPIVHKYLIKNENKTKILPITGSFDEIKLQDNSLDFAIMWDTLHHSFSPIITLKEINRVLKTSGHLIIVDRGHDNKTPQKEIERMMNVIYPEEFIKNNFMPKGTKLSRRDNGENEYRFKELENFFRKSNFDILYRELFLEKHSRNNNYKNDANIKQNFIPIELGGYEKRKIVYILKPSN